jgi:CheY-like chemotaxis protein
MAKKVLVVEESLAVRGIAESLLRQNGYEVFSAARADEARTILQGSRIELLLVSSTAMDAGGRRFLDTLAADPATATLPLLVLHDPASGEPGVPPELMIHKPFTPREFLDAVGAMGTFRQAAPAAPASPFDGAAIEDDIIDAALGLDRLEVDDSKVIGDDTGAFRVLNAKPTKESMIGYEYGANADDSGAMRKKIDQVSIRDSGATPVPPQPPAAAHPPQESGPPPAKPAPETLSEIGRASCRERV